MTISAKLYVVTKQSIEGENAASPGVPLAPQSMPSKARLRFCFSRAKWETLVQLLERHNDYLDRLLQSSSASSATLEPYGTMAIIDAL
jgi:hypothetical protein